MAKVLRRAKEANQNSRASPQAPPRRYLRSRNQHPSQHPPQHHRPPQQHPQTRQQRQQQYRRQQHRARSLFNTVQSPPQSRQFLRPLPPDSPSPGLSGSGVISGSGSDSDSGSGSGNSSNTVATQATQAATSGAVAAPAVVADKNSAHHSGHGQTIATHNNNKMTRTRTISSHQSLLQSPNLNSSRMKRPLDPIDSNFDPPKTKRARIAVEILARPKNQPQSITFPRPIAVQPPQISTKAPPLRPPSSSSSPAAAAAPSHALHLSSQKQKQKQELQKQQKQQQQQHQRQHHLHNNHHHHHHKQQNHDQRSTITKPLPSPSPPSPPPPRTTATKTRTTAALPLPSQPKLPDSQSRKQAAETNFKTATISRQNPTKHQSKLKNGIKHELDRLQPNAADTTSASAKSGRKLRSQEAMRFKSELSAYFPDYDEVIGNDPKEEHILNSDTPIIVIDTDTTDTTDTDIAANTDKSSIPAIQLPHPPSNNHTTKPPPPASVPVRHYGHDLFTNLSDSHRIDFTFLEARYNGKEIDDPLPDSHYEFSHKKAERLEKSIRNTERGRAQHEKDQIIRLLNELQGHDWLRTMGVNGVTESKKKTFEPARDYFIRGCQAILEKFRTWSQEEKRRKLEKERALAEEAGQLEDEDDEEDEEADDSDGNTSESVSGSGEDGEDEEDEEDEEEEEEDLDEDMAMSQRGEADESADESADGTSDKDDDVPDYSDVDASIEKQLLEEATARANYTTSPSSKRSRGEPPTWSAEVYEAREFTSFFDKRHQRDAALNKRRRGRTALAWGHPVPDVPERDFDLPDEYRDEDTLKAHARQKRRARRQGSRHG